MLHFVSILTSVAMLGACVSNQSVSKNLEVWKGKSSSAVEKAWGAPDIIENGSIIYTAKDRGVYVSSVNYLDSAMDSVVQVHDGSCQIVFELGADKSVKAASWSGSLARCYQYSSNLQK